LTLLYIICDRSILLYVYVYMCINLYTVAFDNCFLKNKLECGPMPNVMVALPNAGGALCSTPQSLADAGHY